MIVWNVMHNGDWEYIQFVNYIEQKCQAQLSRLRQELAIIVKIISNFNFIAIATNCFNASFYSKIVISLTYMQFKRLNVTATSNWYLFGISAAFNRYPWWRHQMKTFSVLLALCAGNSPVTGEFPSQRPVTRSFDIFFDMRLNIQLSKL